MVRTRTDEVSVLGRNTQGVRVIRTKDGEFLVGVERIDEPSPEADLFGETVEAAGADTIVGDAGDDTADQNGDGDQD
jgi:DNA gyrase subunit A